jgi:hypothetical protein
MVRSLVFSLVFSLVWINSMAEMARGEFSSEPATIAQDDSIETNMPFCYMQSSNGELMDLTQFCGTGIRRPQTASTLDNQTAIAPTPAIVVPSAPVPRGSACFVFDEQGQPCAPSR